MLATNSAWTWRSNMHHTIKSCKFGSKDCMVLHGTRALEICANCAWVSKGISTTTGDELRVPSNFIAKPLAKITTLRRK